MRRRLHFSLVLASAVCLFGASGGFLSASAAGQIELARTAIGGAARLGSVKALQLELSEVVDSTGSRPLIYRMMMPDRFQMDNGGGVFTLDSRSFAASTGLTERGLVVARQNTSGVYLRSWLLYLLAAPTGSGASFKPATDTTVDGMSIARVNVTFPGGLAIEMWFSKSTHRPYGYRFISPITTSSGESAGTDITELRIRSFQTVGGIEFPKEIETKSSRAADFIAKRTVRVIVNPTAEVDKFFAK